MELCHQQCRPCSILAGDGYECICTHSDAKTFGQQPGIKKGSKEATSLQEINQG